jgi:uncharacterized protein
MSMLDHADVVDVHCHGWRTADVAARDQSGMLDRITMLGMCLISSDLDAPELQGVMQHATDLNPVALAMARRLATLLGCEPARESIAAARAEALADSGGYLERLWRDAGVSALVMDDGYPLPMVDGQALSREAGIPIHRVARIEPMIVDLRDGAAGFSDLEDAFAARAEAALSEGAIAFKSVIAYRTGLDVQPWGRSDCEAAFRRWREDGWRETREHAKPVRDTLLRRTLEVARRGDVPLHVHCGGGDPSVVLSHARPSNLFPLLHEHLRQPIVLIHSGWPWVEEGAYIASILPNVYLDTSLSTPWASLAIDSRLEILLGIASPAQVMYGSDESTEPEVIWLSAQLARESLERVLRSGVERRLMGEEDAARIGAAVLGGNARRLHGLEAPVLGRA